MGDNKDDEKNEKRKQRPEIACVIRSDTQISGLEGRPGGGKV